MRTRTRRTKEIAGIGVTLLLLAVAGAALHADQQVSDDLVVEGRGCVGFDCANEENFGDDTLRIKENNLRIRFIDTSEGGDLPTNDWRITTNDSRNGGTNRFSIDDVDALAIPFDGFDGGDVTADADATLDIAWGDVNNDTYPDLVVGNDGRNRLYLHNGTRGFANPFEGVNGVDLTEDDHTTLAVVLADVTRDGFLDVVAGNQGAPSRLYVNNTTGDPFDSVVGIDITAADRMTTSLALGDLNRDFRLDLIVGNDGQPNLLYLGGSGPSPFSTGTAITTDADATLAVALGDVNGDGRPDLVVGNDGRNRLYLNNSTANPFDGVTGSDITTDDHVTTAVALGDVNGDDLLDLVAGNDGAANRLYLNNGTPSPFDGVSGSDITADVDDTLSLNLVDLNGDARPDLVVGNDGRNRAYLNNRTSDPFAAVSGADIGATSWKTTAVAALTTSPTLILGLPFQTLSPFLATGNESDVNRVFPTGDGDEGSSPFTIEAGAGAAAIYLAEDGPVGLGTPTPEDDVAVDLQGDLRVDGDLQITGGAKGGVVRSNGRSVYRVTFAEPYARDYVIILTAVARDYARPYRPTVLSKNEGGFTFTIGGSAAGYVATHWITRLVGEY